MKKSTRAPAKSHRLSMWWIWVPLISLLVVGCKPREPRELMCRPTAIFEVLEPEKGAGVAPFSIERLGPQVDSRAVEAVPTGLGFTRGNHARIYWMLGHFSVDTEVLYSPAEGLARRVDHPGDVYPVKRFVDGRVERAQLGFRKKVCLRLEKDETYVFCKPGNYSKDERFLVADMTCERQ